MVSKESYFPKALCQFMFCLGEVWMGNRMSQWEAECRKFKGIAQVKTDCDMFKASRKQKRLECLFH